jgi:hypothetical protein
MRNDKGDWTPQSEYLSCVHYEESTFIEIKPIGYLKHESTGYSLAVYKPISRFKRLMLRWCFGLKFEKI